MLLSKQKESFWRGERNFRTREQNKTVICKIKLDNRELKQVDHFKCLGSVLTREIKTRTDMAKEVFSRKISPLTSKLNVKLGKKLVTYYVWSIALYDSET